jgi:hypothetical protein
VRTLIAAVIRPVIGAVIGAGIAAVALAACGGPTRVAPPPPPPPVDTARLAHQLHENLVELGVIARRHRGDCPGLVAALGPHVEAMRAHADEVKRAQQDPEVARRLRRDVAAYDDRHRGLAEAIGGDLGASYQACPDNKQLLQLIDRLPEL